MNTNSLISRDASTAIKGLLILLIVFGHVGMLNTDFVTGEKTFLFKWLYTFHVHVFFILPFIYGYESNNTLKRSVLRTGVPYFWFFLLYLLVFLTVGGGSFNLKGVCYSFVVGSQPLLKEYIGFHLMWFLPAYFALTLIKRVWYNSGKFVRAICLSISIAIWGLSLFGVLDMSQIGRYAPFSLSEGFAYLLLGLATRKMLEAFPVKVLWPCAMAGIFVMSVMFYFRCGISANLYYFARLLMPVFVFIVLYVISDFLAKSRFLKFFGRYSLQIYLTHVLVINVLMTGLLHFTKESIPVGILILFLSMAISSGIAVVIDKIAFLKKMLFPSQNHGSN